MAVYNDLFVRSFPDDTNNYPKPSSCSPWTSPDIIPYGSQVCINPSEIFLGDNFNKSFNNEVQTGMDNYLYIRAKNYADKTQTGKLYLYWSPSALLLAPSLWKNNVIKTTSNQDCVDFSVDAQTEFITNNDAGGLFQWKPDAITGDHYCLVSRVVTNEHPAPIPDLKDIHDFAVFMRSEASMGYAQRNVSLISKNIPEYSSEMDIDNPYDSPLEEGYLTINCEKVPNGCEVALSCPGSTSACYLDIPKTVVSQNVQKNFSISVHFKNMPAHFKSKVKFYLWFNENVPTESFNAYVDFVEVEHPTTKGYAIAKPLSNFAIDRLHTFEHNDVLVGDAVKNFMIGPKRAIRVGSCEHICEV